MYLLESTQPLNRSCKGQLISECLFEFLNFPKKNPKKFDKFLPQNQKKIGEINKINNNLIRLKIRSFGIGGWIW